MDTAKLDFHCRIKLFCGGQAESERAIVRAIAHLFGFVRAIGVHLRKEDQVGRTGH